MTTRLPLFDWPKAQKMERDIATLEGARSALTTRIEKLPPMAHKRIELEVRLRQITAEAMKLEHDLAKDGVAQ